MAIFNINVYKSINDKNEQGSYLVDLYNSSSKSDFILELWQAIEKDKKIFGNVLKNFFNQYPDFLFNLEESLDELVQKAEKDNINPAWLNNFISFLLLNTDVGFFHQNRNLAQVVCDKLKNQPNNKNLKNLLEVIINNYGLIGGTINEPLVIPDDINFPDFYFAAGFIDTKANSNKNIFILRQDNTQDDNDVLNQLLSENALLALTKNIEQFKQVFPNDSLTNHFNHEYDNQISLEKIEELTLDDYLTALQVRLNFFNDLAHVFPAFLNQINQNFISTFWPSVWGLLIGLSAVIGCACVHGAAGGGANPAIIVLLVAPLAVFAAYLFALIFPILHYLGIVPFVALDNPAYVEKIGLLISALTYLDSLSAIAINLGLLVVSMAANYLKPSQYTFEQMFKSMMETINSVGLKLQTTPTTLQEALELRKTIESELSSKVKYLTDKVERTKKLLPMGEAKICSINNRYGHFQAGYAQGQLQRNMQEAKKNSLIPAEKRGLLPV